MKLIELARLLFLRKKLVRGFIALAQFQFLAFHEVASAGEFDDQMESVSIISLIGSPERYENKLVSVTGAASFHKEGNPYVCLNKESVQKVMLQNCIRLGSFSEKVKAKPLPRVLLLFDESFIIVEGRFKTPHQFQQEYIVGADGRKIPIPRADYFSNGSINELTRIIKRSD